MSLGTCRVCLCGRPLLPIMAVFVTVGTTSFDELIETATSTEFRGVSCIASSSQREARRIKTAHMTLLCTFHSLKNKIIAKISI